jgi:hypothetical protein
VIEPSFSLGSSQRGASVKCTAQVIWPVGAADGPVAAMETRGDDSQHEADHDPTLDSH